jgi:CRISPR-associated DxTHG motif protein
MKRAVITVLGMIGHTKLDYTCKDMEIIKTFPEKKEEDKAKYHFGEKLKNEFQLSKTKYINMLPIICELYKDDLIIPLYTEKAKEIQKKVLEYEGISTNILDNNNGLIKDEKNFPEIFANINKILDNKDYDKVVIDITHGFRHLPILMTINLILENIQHTGKIEHFLFAKEIKPGQEYEIIDLKEYLDIANISYALSSFTKNYTISGNITTSNKIYNDFLNELNNFSEHILANSLDALILTTNKKQSISEILIKQIDKILEEDEILKNFESYLIDIRKHIEEIKSYAKLTEYEKMFKLSSNMLAKGYFLNSITLLNEAVGLFCKDEFKKISDEIKLFIETFESEIQHRKNNSRNNKYQLYSLSDQSKNLYKLNIKFKGNFLSIKYPNDKERKFNKTSEIVTVKIKYHLIDIKDDQIYKDRVELIDEISRLRNNLAHGNSSQRLKDVKNDICDVLEKFNKLFLFSKHKITKKCKNKK